ncbi:MAG: beta-lactamase family protein [Candidatus Binataceae bacterium]|nr:beta-lactamase family protein [Candidatus Binataceae bacterium]
MPTEISFAADPREAGLDPEKVTALLDRANEEVQAGLLPAAQIAIARHGKIGAMRSYGIAVQAGIAQPVDNETLFPVFSCTKAVVSAAAWILIGEGKLDPGERVADIIEGFGANGKDAVIVEHLFLHTAGFPNASMPPLEWLDRIKRQARFASWRLEWLPGSRFVYHPTATFWAIAEIIERRGGEDFRSFIRNRIASPLALDGLSVGLDKAKSRRVADLVFVGDSMTDEQLQLMGLPAGTQPAVTEQALLGINDPAVREVGIPGGGGLMTTGDLALFYQSVLGHLDGSRELGIWRRDTLIDALRVRSGDLSDPMIGVKVNRALGVIVAGDDGLGAYRGFGNGGSPLAFGHGGAGGQIGWADPDSGISFAYSTNGMDRNFIRQIQRGIALSTLAAACAL